ncbi:polysaccharide lyase [Onishia niordana]|uniref:polysaccharide lyase n=1 Tax=Onishia niordana TaxID=2508711 RepID=UPI00197AD6C6|nr:hypothetical protein [Halomonas niordiana]
MLNMALPRSRQCSARGLALTLLLAVSSAASATTVADDRLSLPQTGPCSQRYDLVAALGPLAVAADVETVVREEIGAHRAWGLDNVEMLTSTADGREMPALRVAYPAGTSSPSDAGRGGAGFYVAPQALAGAERACLRYRVRFSPGFDFVKGGKLPGLYGGEAPSGGVQADGENGFTMRFMWRRDGQGELYEYVVNQDSDYGVSVGRGRWSFPSGQWVTVEQELVLNDPQQENGLARVWIDGRPVLEQRGILYRTTDALTIDGLMFSTFFGGHGADWRTPRDQHADFAGFRLYTPLP